MIKGSEMSRGWVPKSHNHEAEGPVLERGQSLQCSERECAGKRCCCRCRGGLGGGNREAGTQAVAALGRPGRWRPRGLSLWSVRGGAWGRASSGTQMWLPHLPSSCFDLGLGGEVPGWGCEQEAVGDALKEAVFLRPQAPSKGAPVFLTRFARLLIIFSSHYPLKFCLPEFSPGGYYSGKFHQKPSRHLRAL